MRFSERMGRLATLVARLENDIAGVGRDLAELQQDMAMADSGTAGAARAHRNKAARYGTIMRDTIYSILLQEETPMHYTAIYTKLRERGLSVPGDNPRRNVGAHLSLDTRFVNVARGMWTLRERQGAAV